MIREVTYYKVICDWPGCEHDAHQDEGSDYAAWGSAGDAEAEADSADWHEDKDEKRRYCRRHPSAWASDDDRPQPPYLLIDDDDDGRVTLVEPEVCS